MLPLARIFTDSALFFDLTSFKIDGYRIQLTAGRSYQPCDLAVVFGMPNYTSEVDRIALRNDVHSRHRGPLLVVESWIIGRVYTLPKRPWLDRLFGRYQRPESHFPFWRLAVNAAFGPEANFNNKNSPPERWEKLGISIKPYRSTGDHIILIGQTPGDSSLRGVDIVHWLVETASKIRRLSHRPILVRFHPRMGEGAAEAARPQLETIENVRIAARDQPISESLANAWATVTLSSGAAIDSLIAGVPAITLSRDSLAYEITSHDLPDIECPPKPPREQWLYDLAYAQWTPEEYADGTAWRHIALAVATAARPQPVT